MKNRNRSYTIYDVLDDKGVFAKNPANVGAYNPETGESLYAGPVPYPMMMYHPEGELEVINPGQTITDNNGIPILDRHGAEIVRGRQEALVNRIVHTEAEEAEARADGWHDRPWKAHKAAGRKFAPVQEVETPLSSREKDEYIAELEARYKALVDSTKPTEQLLAEQQRPGEGSGGGVVPVPASVAAAALQESGLLETDDE